MCSLLKPPEFFQDPAAQQQKQQLQLRDGRGTPSRASLQAPVARAAAPAARSMSPPRWSQAPQAAPGVGTAWTWPATGTLNRGTTYTPATPWAPSIHSSMCFFTIWYTLFICCGFHRRTRSLAPFKKFPGKKIETSSKASFLGFLLRISDLFLLKEGWGERSDFFRDMEGVQRGRVSEILLQKSKFP